MAVDKWLPSFHFKTNNMFELKNSNEPNWMCMSVYNKNFSTFVAFSVKCRAYIIYIKALAGVVLVTFL